VGCITQNVDSKRTHVLFKRSVSCNHAQVTSKHKHRCCPCPKLADFVSLMLD